MQVRHLGHAIACVLGRYDPPEENGDISHFKVLSTALSATIGTGNIAGVATAIAADGPGAAFWMRATALVGMAIPNLIGLILLSEVVVKETELYCIRLKNGEFHETR